MMGKPGSLIRELTETRERALAWLFRGTLSVILILGTGLISLSTYFVYDLRDRSEKAWAAGSARMDRIETSQNELKSKVAVFGQFISDITESRNRELRDLDQRVHTLETKVK